MKKSLILFILLILLIEVHGDIKMPIFPSEVQKYLLYSNHNEISKVGQKDLYEILSALVGDTIAIENNGYSLSYSNEIAFTKDVPDTIWIKKKRNNNIEGKHYFLDSIYKSTYSEFYYPNTSIPERVQCNFRDVIIILAVDSNNICSFISTITGEKGKWKPHINEVDIVSKSIEKRLSSTLLNYPFYYIVNKDTVVCSCDVSTIGYHFSASNIKSKNSFDFSYKYRDSYSYQSKEEKFTLNEEYMYETIRRHRDYKFHTIENLFIPKEVGDSMLWRRDSLKIIENKKISQDSIFLCTRKAPEWCLIGSPGNTNKKVNIYVYSYAGRIGRTFDIFNVIYQGEKYSIKGSDIEQTNDVDLQYLKERGCNGESIRYKNAVLADEQYWIKARQNAQLAKEKREREKKELVQELKKEECFLIEMPSLVDKPYSDYEGVEFEFYNCYNKTINYIYYKTVAYNTVGDKQYDYSGKDTKYIEIIGPIQPESIKREYNDEIFYDNQEKISKIRIEEMRIVFSDGTSKHFKSYSEILSHYKHADL